MRTCCSLLSLLALAACNSNPSELSSQEKANTREEVKQTLDDYNRAVLQRGLTAEFDYLDNSKDFSWTPPGYSDPISFDSVSSLIRQNAQTLKSVHNSFETLQINPISDKLAGYRARIHSIVTDTAGRVTRIELMELGVLIRRVDGWKLISGETHVVK